MIVYTQLPPMMENLYIYLQGSRATIIQLVNNRPLLDGVPRLCYTVRNISMRVKKMKVMVFLTLQASELVQESEQINKPEQQHEDLCTDEKTHEEQMAKVVFLEEQIQNLTDEQELVR